MRRQGADELMAGSGLVVRHNPSSEASRPRGACELDRRGGRSAKEPYWEPWHHNRVLQCPGPGHR
jgi:hypothetical protein